MRTFWHFVCILQATCEGGRDVSECLITKNDILVCLFCCYHSEGNSNRASVTVSAQASKLKLFVMASSVFK